MSPSVELVRAQSDLIVYFHLFLWCARALKTFNLTFPRDLLFLQSRLIKRNPKNEDQSDCHPRMTARCIQVGEACVLRAQSAGSRSHEDINVTVCVVPRQQTLLHTLVHAQVHVVLPPRIRSSIPAVTCCVRRTFVCGLIAVAALSIIK